MKTFGIYGKLLVCGAKTFPVNINRELILELFRSRPRSEKFKDKFPIDIDWKCLRTTNEQFTVNSKSFHGLSTLLVIQSNAAEASAALLCITSNVESP